jgi:RNA polymerase sigma factor (sigma-70 family)
MSDAVSPVLRQVPLTSDDFSRHDTLDARRLAALRDAIAKGEDQLVRVLLGELIAGWRPIVEGYLATRTGQEVAEEVISRLEVKLLRLLLRKQEFTQAWGKVVWENAKWVLSDVLKERQREIERRAKVEDISAEIGDPTSGFEIEALDERLSVDADRLNRALARLSDNDRRLFEMIYWEDMDDADAAAELDLAPGTFAVRKHRALERLGAAFSDPDVIDPSQAPE